MADNRRRSRKQFHRAAFPADAAAANEPFPSRLARFVRPQMHPVFTGRVMRSNLPPFVVSATAATTYLAFLVQGGEVID